MIPPVPGNSPQVNLVNECFRAFNESNTDIVRSHLHKDFSNVIYPKSLGVPARDTEGHIEHYAGLILVNGYGLTYHSVIEAPGKIVIHATVEAENPIGLDTKCEAMYIVHFVTDDDGSLKSKQLDEFNDSKVYPGIHKALAEAKAGK